MPYDPAQPRGPDGRWTNSPGQPYVSRKSITELRRMADSDGYISAGLDKGSRECAALVKAALPELGPTSQWKKGPTITGADDPVLRPGTAIGKGFDENGTYPSKSTGNHVALVVGPGDKAGTVKILHQWRTRRAHMQDIDGSAIRGWSIVTRKK